MKYFVKEKREEAGLTQEALAQKSGVSRMTICMMENDTNKVVTVKTLLKLADAMGVKVETLFSA